jgi:hypothetical protein
MKLPNLLLVGTPKAGTTSVHNYLDAHPEVFMSRVKEPHYFSEVGPNCPTVDAINDWREYTDLFADSKDARIVGESSISYLHCTMAVERIRKVLGKPRILIILREPVSRCFSHWLMDFREGYQQKPFLEAVKDDYYNVTKKGFCSSHMYIESSLYFDAVERYLNTFGDNVKIMFYEDLRDNPRNFMKELFKFLGVDESFEPDLSRRDNTAAVPRNKLVRSLFHNMKFRKMAKKAVPVGIRKGLRSCLLKPVEKISISDMTRKYLSQFFVDDTMKIQRLINKDLSVWSK